MTVFSKPTMANDLKWYFIYLQDSCIYSVINITINWEKNWADNQQWKLSLVAVLLREYYPQWKTKLRKEPGTKSEMSRAEQNHAVETRRQAHLCWVTHWEKIKPRLQSLVSQSLNWLIVPALVWCNTAVNDRGGQTGWQLHFFFEDQYTTTQI